MAARDPFPALHSARSTRRIERLFAIVVQDAEGIEGVVRRDTPIGAQPLTTDDEHLARLLLLYARQVVGPGAYLVAFRREA